MLQHIFALPLVAKIIGLLGVAAFGVWGWAKHKAIVELSSAAKNEIEARLFGWFGKKLYSAAPPPSAIAPPTTKGNQERTYGGTFIEYGAPANRRNRYYFAIEQDGMIHRVPVIISALLSDLRGGDVVEIDTQTGIYPGEEVVVRVRMRRKS